MDSDSRFNVRLNFSGLCTFVPRNDHDPLDSPWDVLLPHAANAQEIPGSDSMLPHVPLLVLPTASIMPGAPSRAKTFWDLYRREVTFRAFDSDGNEIAPKLEVERAFLASDDKGWLVDLDQIDPEFAVVDARCLETPPHERVASRFVIDRGSLYRRPANKPADDSAGKEQDGDRDSQWFFPGATRGRSETSSDGISTPAEARYLTRGVSLEFLDVGALLISARDLDGAKPVESFKVSSAAKGSFVEVEAGNLCSEDLLAALERRSSCPEWEKGRPGIDADFRFAYWMAKPDLEVHELFARPVPTTVVRGGGGLGGCKPKCFCQKLSRSRKSSGA